MKWMALYEDWEEEGGEEWEEEEWGEEWEEE